MRLWLLTVGGVGAPPPVAITDEGVAGAVELDPSRGRAAFIDDEGRLRVIDLATRNGAVLAEGLGAQVVCGWLDGGDIVIRTATTPIRLTRVEPRTGAQVHYREIAPPAVGLKAVDSLVLRRDGGLWVYSYGQELSRLYLMTL